MLPSESQYWAGGFELKEENYSTPGSGNGLFANMMAGEPDWQRGPAIPVFETKSGTGYNIEGVTFTNNVDEAIKGLLRVRHEMTALIIAQPSDPQVARALFGSTRTTQQGFRMTVNGRRLTTAGSSVGSGQTSDSSPAGRPSLFTGTWSPDNGTFYAQINLQPIKFSTHEAKNVNFIDWYEAAIGMTRVTYAEGWIGAGYFMNRGLHHHDPEELLAIQTTLLTDVLGF